MSLGLPAPVFGLRPELDRDALEQALHPAAGLEEAGADRLRAAYPYLGAEKAA
ncbi:MAG: hypothetical protein HYZ93_00320 [Candidatus Omnitrophica bacterium]|nr:hypothetical protein [Candidatus Omnitrophota bacterium]